MSPVLKLKLYSPTRRNIPVMPPSSSPLPGERSYRDISYVGMDEKDANVDSVESLMKKMELASKTEVSVDELAHSLKEHFNLEADDSNIRNLAQFVMRLNLKEPVDASNDARSHSNTREDVASREEGPKLSMGKKDRSSSRNRGSSPSASNPFTPPIQEVKPASRSPLRSQSPSSRFYPRSSSKKFDPSGMPPPTPFRSRPSPVKATPVVTTASVDFSFSPPSSTGTFDSIDRTFDSENAMADTPGFNVDTPSVSTPMAGEVSAKVEEVTKTGVAKRRNKNETITPDLKAFVPPEQSTLPQDFRSPPQFNVNLKKSKKPVAARLRRQHPRPQSQPESVQKTFPPAVTTTPLNLVPPQIPIQVSGLAAPSAQQDAAPFTTIPHPIPAAFVNRGTFQPSPLYHAPQTAGVSSPLNSPMDLDVKFNMGSTPTTKRSSPSSRPRRSTQKKIASPRHRFSSASDARPVEPMPQSSFTVEAVVQPASQNALPSKTTTPVPTIDYSGRDAMVEAFRKEARELYIEGNYPATVRKYTLALAAHNSMTVVNGRDDRRATLLANRAAALLMLGAYEAAACGCKEAVTFVTDLEPTGIGEYVLSGEGGPLLKAKVYTRMGRAHIKMGDLDDAAHAFDKALDIIQMTLDNLGSVSVENRTLLSQVQIDASAGKTEISRCREAVDAIKKCGLRTPKDASTVSRIFNLRALSSVNAALSLAPGCQPLLEMKVACLASLNRWREVYLSCERIASETVNFDGVFTDDLLPHSPLPNVPVAKYLKASVSEKEEMGKLSSKAVAEAVLRLPASLQPHYIRALRLEERCDPALNALNALCEFVNAFVVGAELLKLNWIVNERKRLDRTIDTKSKGDCHFRSADYQAAVDQYTICLQIDSCERPLESEGHAGGRLHAVLHCNRAAAYMALLKYRDAIADCTAALRIHSHYMKAMLRRSRCYVRLNRFDEAQTEYERYIHLVETARAASATSTAFENMACVFDLPRDVRDGDLFAVKEELNEVTKAKINAENNKRREEAERQSRQNWYQESFGHSKPGDAERRRQEWYSQQGKGSRRWDSFNGRGPNSQGSNANHGESSNGARTSSRRAYSYREEHEQRDQQPRQETRGQDERKENVFGSPGSDKSVCHYKVLQLSSTATENEIKKAYKVAALKYHPDKNQQSGATDMFRRVKLAYDVLKDPAQKREYDLQLRWSRRF